MRDASGRRSASLTEDGRDVAPSVDSAQPDLAADDESEEQDERGVFGGQATLGLQRIGCIRVSASLNQVFDKYGVLDADYEAALERGVPLWVLRKDRTPTPWSGRYLVVVESERAHRPPWASLTYGDRKAGKPSSSTAY